MLRCGLDLDDTIFSFMRPYLDRFGTPKEDSEITRNVHKVLKYDKEFWLNQPVINRPNFEVTLYCTKRIHNKNWTKQQLEINNLPIAPIYQVYSQSSSKAPRIKGRVDVFIEDSISNFIDLNKKGIPCLLIDSPFNQSWGPIGRIYNLDYDSICEAYELFMLTIFPNFKNLIK